MPRYLLLPALLASTAMLTLPMAVSAQETSRSEQARITVGVPVYVEHPDSRSGGRDWNEGWFQNEGALVDVSWPVHKLGERTHLRLGATAGGFDNSEFHTSIFVGGMAEIETYATDDLAFSLGTYAGAITGYQRDVAPAIAPYIGASYAVTDTIELGLRGFWLPGETLAGSSVVESDAYVGAFTVGTRF